MQRHPIRDLFVGLFVLAGLAAIAYLSMSVGGLSYAGPGGLRVFGRFDELGGLKLRAPVVISGVKVGQVVGISLDEAMRAKVELEIDASIELPVDSSAGLVTAGLLGDRYVNLQPGGEEELLANGDEISFTESAVLLESLIGKLMYGTPGDGRGDAPGATPGGADAAKETIE
jgi:phospholipid/cholesterol/gamma-HCH transport system substrate-binding protein